MLPFSRTKILTIILIIAIVATPIGLSLSTSLHIQRAEAQMDLGELGKGFVVGAAACVGVAFIMKYISAGIALIPSGPVPESSGETPVKKALDCILYQVVNAIIEDMIRSITTWIQSGFQGNPVFVTQVDRYMLSVLDTVAGAYIQEKVPLLCSPFAAEVQLALTQSYQQSSGRLRGSCSLTEAVGNIDSFLSGDFYSGGWGGWVDMVSNPYNNPYGSYLEGQMGMQIRLSNASGKQTQDLLQGRGFLSKQVQDCFLTPPGGGDPVPYDETQMGPPQGTVTCDEPRTVTPGSFIQEQVGKQMGRSSDRLDFADEINEMITALFAYLMQNVLTGEGGLADYDEADYADQDYPELPSVDEFPIDPGTGGDGCYPRDLWTVFESTPGTPGTPKTLNEPQTFVSSAEHPTREYDISMPPMQDYTHVRATFDVKAGPYSGAAQQHNIFWLHRSPNIGQMDWHANLVAEVVATTAQNGRLRLGTSINLDNGDSCPLGLTKATGFRFEEGQTYRVTVDYNTLPVGAGRMSVQVKKGNNEVAYVEQDVTVDYLQSNNPEGQPPGGGFFVVLGSDLNVGADEAETYGWEWSDLRVEFEP